MATPAPPRAECVAGPCLTSSARPGKAIQPEHPCPSIFPTDLCASVFCFGVSRCCASDFCFSFSVSVEEQQGNENTRHKEDTRSLAGCRVAAMLAYHRRPPIAYLCLLLDRPSCSFIICSSPSLFPETTWLELQDGWMVKIECQEKKGRGGGGSKQVAPSRSTGIWQSTSSCSCQYPQVAKFPAHGV